MKKGLLFALVMLICFSFVITAPAAGEPIATTTMKGNAYLHKQPNDSNSDSQGVLKAGTTVEVLEELPEKAFGSYWCRVRVDGLEGYVMKTKLNDYAIEANVTETNVVENDILFRGFQWGASLDDVMSKEITKDMVEGIDYVVNDDHQLVMLGQKVAGHNTITAFEFTSDWKLRQGAYVLDEEHVSENSYYEDFKDLEKKLIELYGTPTNSLDDWKDSLYKDDPEKIGFAIAAEHLDLYRNWASASGSVLGLACTGSNFDISISIFYFAPDDIGLETEASDTSGL